MWGGSSTDLDWLKLLWNGILKSLQHCVQRYRNISLFSFQVFVQTTTKEEHFNFLSSNVIFLADHSKAITPSEFLLVVLVLQDWLTKSFEQLNRALTTCCLVALALLCCFWKGTVSVLQSLICHRIFCNIEKLYFARLICCLGVSVSLLTGCGWFFFFLSPVFTSVLFFKSGSITYSHLSDFLNQRN